MRVGVGVGGEREEGREIKEGENAKSPSAARERESIQYGERAIARRRERKEKDRGRKQGWGGEWETVEYAAARAGEKQRETAHVREKEREKGIETERQAE